MAVARFTKQPNETLDYYFSFEDWLAAKAGLTITSHAVDADAGITVSHSRAGAIVRVVVSGGVAGSKYKVTVRVTTDGLTPLVKELEAIIAVKEL